MAAISNQPTSAASINIVDQVSTLVLPAPGIGKKLNIRSLVVTNAHASTGTWVKILAGATVIARGYAAAGGAGYVFPIPNIGLVLPANTALNAQNETDGADVVVTAAGYIAS